MKAFYVVEVLPAIRKQSFHMTVAYLGDPKLMRQVEWDKTLEENIEHPEIKCRGLRLPDGTEQIHSIYVLYQCPVSYLFVTGIETAPFVSVAEINDQPDRHPGKEHQPAFRRYFHHQVQTRSHSKHRDEGKSFDGCCHRYARSQDDEYKE